MSGRGAGGVWRDEDGDPIDPWVRVLPDPGGCCLWERSGAGMSCETVPASAALEARMDRWMAWYDRCDEIPLPRDPTFDYAAFAAEGLAIARALKAELPDWTVIYFDITRCDYGRRSQPREEFEYEIGPGGTLPEAATRPLSLDSRGSGGI